MARAVRALFVVGLFLCLALAGCLKQDGPRLATPTNAPNPIFPTPNITRPTPVTPNTFNTSDAGYVIAEGWSVGDAWYWETNRTPVRFRSMHVLEKYVDGPRVAYLIEETGGFVLNEPQGRMRVLVDGNNWTRVRGDDAAAGTSIRWNPPAPGLRYHSNGTFYYNESGSGSGGIVWNEQHAVRSFFATFETKVMPWGESRETARIEHRDLVTDSATGVQRRDLTIHWVDRKFLNDVLIAIDGNHDGDLRDDEDHYYALIGARVGGTKYGRLVFP